MPRIRPSSSTLPAPPLPGTLGPTIARAFEPAGAKWRTVGGIARTSRLTEAAVRKYIRDHRDLFIAAPVAPAGKRLYAVKAKAESRRAQSLRSAAS